MHTHTHTDGQSDVEVNLIAKKYIERGGSLILACKHNVEQDKLYKVTWLKSSSKIFEYIKSREPPYRNFTVPGADIDVRCRCHMKFNIKQSIFIIFLVPSYSFRNQIKMK